MLRDDRQMDHPRGMPGMDVMEVPALLQGVEGSVHRRLVDPSSDDLLGLFPDVRRSEMRVGCLTEHLTDRTPRLGDAEALFAQGVDEIGGSFRHLRIVPAERASTVVS